MVAILFALVFAIGSLPILFVYFAGLKEGQASGETAPGPPAREVALTRLIPQPVAAFINVNLIPMDSERIVANQTVIVRNGKITEIGPDGEVTIPTRALKIDGRGKYLLPGLVDAHVHLRGSRATTIEMLDLFVANGVTTVVNLYGTPEHLELRAKSARGEMRAPQIYTSGPFISDATDASPTPDEVESAIVEQKREGYDLIKTHGDFTREAYRRLFVVARREGLRVIGHATRNLGVEPMIEEKLDAVAHAEEYIYAYFFHKQRRVGVWEKLSQNARRRVMDEQAARIPQLAEATARAGTWVVPTLAVYKGIGLQVKDIASALARPEINLVPREIGYYWEPDRNHYVRRFRGEDNVDYFARQYELLLKLIKGFRDAGVKMMAGTDTPVPVMVPGYSLHDELEEMVAAGLTPYEALRAATANTAEFLGAAGKFGTITVGGQADLLLIDGNPLTGISATRRRAGVMLRGQWLRGR